MSGKLPRPAKDLLLKKNNIVLSTNWAEWGECSECARLGLRRRTGLCIVKVSDFDFQDLYYPCSNASFKNKKSISTLLRKFSYENVYYQWSKMMITLDNV